MTDQFDVQAAIRKTWAAEFRGDVPWDCNWAAFKIPGVDRRINIIGPTRGEPDLSDTTPIEVDGVTFHTKW